MKVLKLEIMVIDFDGVGVDGAKDVIENARYPNRCISPHVMAAQEADIGDWGDNNPLNFASTQAVEFQRLFDSRPDDFAKIVRATSGHQVLFRLTEDEDSGGKSLDCIAVIGGIETCLSFGGLPDDAIASALDKVDVAMADKVIDQIKALGLT